MRDWDAVRNAATILRLEHSREIRIGEVAARTYTSVYHLSRLFKRATGLAPVTWLMAVRMERAVQLLLQTDLSITDVALETGYSSLGTFISRFRRWMGLSPGQFRAYARGGGQNRFRPRHCRSSQGGTLAGEVMGPTDLLIGGVHVALFTTPFPDGDPVRCAVLERCGPFRLTEVPPGPCWLMAAANTEPQFQGDLSCAELVAAAGAAPIVISPGMCLEGLQLLLRPRTVIDPPILGIYTTEHGKFEEDW